MLFGTVLLGTVAWIYIGYGKPNNIVKNVTKSNSELTGPKVTMKRLMKEISHRFGRSMYSGSTLSVVMTVWEVS